MNAVTSDNVLNILVEENFTAKLFQCYQMFQIVSQFWGHTLCNTSNTPIILRDQKNALRIGCVVYIYTIATKKSGSIMVIEIQVIFDKFKITFVSTVKVPN